MIHKVSSGFDHPAGAAGRAEAATLAGECDQVLVTAGIALDPQEPVLEQAALQVVVELLFDERGKRSAFGFESSEKSRVVGLDDSVEWCLFWSMALVDEPVGAAGLWQSS
jgi:hypothetical protein